MNNNDDKERWETFCKLYDKLSSKEEMRELFEEEIKCFSLYLSHVNQDYVYNATFLPQFKDDFWNFLCAFNKKYKIVEKLFDVAEKYYNVTLKIDRYWMMTVDEKGKIKKSTLSGVDYICEKEMMIELQKLLFCKLTTTFDEKTAGQYYKVTKGAGNYDNVDKIEQNEKECWAFKEKSDKFVRGIPQGLPQSYFLGNIYMISIAEIFRKKFTGVSYFYVDDSVIFTNDVREDNFKEQLKELNKQIADEANNFEEDSAIYPEGTEKFYKSDLYGVNVHLDGKSNYTRLDNLDDSEVYLKCMQISITKWQKIIVLNY